MTDLSRRRSNVVVDPGTVWRSLAAETRDRLGEAAIARGLLALLDEEVASEAEDLPPGIVFHADDVAAALAADALRPFWEHSPTERPIPDLHSLAGLRFCHRCGCTDEHACPDGCTWAGPALCSACATAAVGLAPAAPIDASLSAAQPSAEATVDFYGTLSVMLPPLGRGGRPDRGGLLIHVFADAGTFQLKHWIEGVFSAPFQRLIPLGAGMAGLRCRVELYHWSHA